MRALWTIVLAYMLLGPIAEAATYYVSTTGNDANPGTKSAPWKTIQKAANTMVAGDTTYVRRGTYHERVIVKNSGASGAFIKLFVYPGETVIIDGTGINVPDYGGLMEVNGKSYVKLSGFTVRNVGPNAYSVGILTDQGSHILIQNNHTINTMSSGIAAWGGNLTGGGNHIQILRNTVEQCVNGGHSECLSVAGVDTFEVAYNHVHHVGPNHLGTGAGGEGICIKDGSSFGLIHDNHVHHTHSVGIYLDAWDKHTHDLRVYRNNIHDISDVSGNVGGNGIALASENGGLLEKIDVFDNLSYMNHLNGVMVGGYGNPVPHHPIQKVKIVNNTFYKNGTVDWGGGILLDNRELRGTVVRNNIFSANGAWQIYVLETIPTANYRIDHNLINNFVGKYPQETLGKAYVKGKAKFVDAARGDFHLQFGSPAIDAGAALDAPPIDFDAVIRPRGAGYDIGAFEYLGILEWKGVGP